MVFMASIFTLWVSRLALEAVGALLKVAITTLFSLSI